MPAIDARVIPAWRRKTRVTALALFASMLLLAAWAMMFNQFMFYDDEGYVLLSLRNFAEHGRLYRDVFTQYGPLPYVGYWLLHLADIPIVHTTGRIVTFLAWVGAVLCSAGVAWRATRSLTLLATVLAGSFTYLWVMVSEPSHPGGLIALITALLAWAGSGKILVGRNSSWACFVGAGVAALMLTKINVGAFAAIAAGAFTLLNARDERLQRVSPWIVASGFVVLPWLLMGRLLHDEWVQTFALVFSLSAAALTVSTAVARERVFGFRELRCGLVGAMILVLIVLGITIYRGSRPADLLKGMLLDPLRHPSSFSISFRWGAFSRPVALTSAGLCAASIWLRRCGRPKISDVLVATLKFGGALALLGVLLCAPVNSADIVLSYGLACLWFFSWPLTSESAPTSRARTWIGLLLLGQFLHPFPVPGSQIAWGTFLLIPLAAIEGWRSAIYLANHLRILARASAAGAAACGGLAGVALLIGLQFVNVSWRYFDSRKLTLPGTDLIRLPTKLTAHYEILSLNARLHADLLFSLPGMFSFNMWTGVPTPTLANVTHWFSILTPDEQNAIITALDAHPRAAVIVDTGHVEFLRKLNLAPTGPLYDYIQHNYEPAFVLDETEFRIRKGRHVAPYFTAEVSYLPVATDPSVVEEAESARLVVPLLLPWERSIAQVEAITANQTGPIVKLSSENAHVELTPITEQGDPRGPPRAAQFPFRLQGPTLVTLYFDGREHPFDSRDTVIVVRDTSGEQLGLVRLRQ